MKIIVAIAFYFLYWGVCFLGTGTDKKNLMGLRSYPEEVQNRVRSDHQLGKAVPKGKSTAAVWLSNLLLFTVVFSALGLALRGVLNLDGYLSAFWYFLAFSEGLGLFDLLVIDLLWWRNTKRTRFSFLPEKKYYQNPKKTYRIVLARHPVVCRSRCTVSLDRHSVLNHARPVQCGFCSDGTASRKAGADDHLCGRLPMRLYHLRR